MSVLACFQERRSLGRAQQRSLTTTIMSDNDSPHEEAAQPTGDSISSPAEFLKVLVGKRVKVRLTSGVDYLGEDMP